MYFSLKFLIFSFIISVGIAHAIPTSPVYQALHRFQAVYRKLNDSNFKINFQLLPKDLDSFQNYDSIVKGGIIKNEINEIYLNRLINKLHLINSVSSIVLPTNVQLYMDSIDGAILTEKYNSPSGYVSVREAFQDDSIEKVKLINTIGYRIHEVYELDDLVPNDIYECVLYNKDLDDIKFLLGLQCITKIDVSDEDVNNYNENTLFKIQQFFMKNVLVELDIPEFIISKQDVLSVFDLSTSMSDLYNALSNILNLTRVYMDLLDNRIIFILQKLISISRSVYYMDGFSDFYELHTLNSLRLSQFADETEESFDAHFYLSQNGIVLIDRNVNFRLKFNDIIFAATNKMCFKSDCQLIEDIDYLKEILKDNELFLVPLQISHMGPDTVGHLAINNVIYNERGFDIGMDNTILPLHKVYSQFFGLNSIKDVMNDIYELIENLADLQQLGITLTPINSYTISEDTFLINPLLNDTTTDSSSLVKLYKHVRSENYLNTMLDNFFLPDVIFKFSYEENLLFDKLIERDYIEAKNIFKKLLSLNIPFLPLEFKFDKIRVSNVNYPVMLGLDLTKPKEELYANITKFTNIFPATDVILNYNSGKLFANMNILPDKNTDISLYTERIRMLSHLGYSVVLFVHANVNFNGIILDIKNEQDENYVDDILSYVGLPSAKRNDISAEYFNCRSIVYYIVNNWTIQLAAKDLLLESMDLVYDSADLSSIYMIIENIKFFNKIDDNNEIFMNITKMDELISIMQKLKQVHKPIIDGNLNYRFLLQKIKHLFTIDDETKYIEELNDIINNFNVFKTKSSKIPNAVENKLLLDDLCPICRVSLDSNEDDMNDPEDEIILHSCRRGYHRECIEPWLETNPSCPMCRQDMEI